MDNLIRSLFGSNQRPPAGYQWSHPRWSPGADGARDYAAFHGFAEFSVLRPVSSRLRSPSRWRARLESALA